MAFRHDMRGYTSQQQAIVRNRDKQDEILRNQSKKKENEIECQPIENNGPYASVLFTKNSKSILQLRVSDTAMKNEPCKLKHVDIHKWLCKIGREFIDQVEKFEILMITSHDVKDQKLITNWKNLRREQAPE
ncbi:hypothetical protein ABES38_11705 [Bacillus gobiensis]|uniref:hypothetical protein n=1 Tax=Bacillus gobiensis TaxID=1441095 RepID=UPI003D1B85AE